MISASASALVLIETPSRSVGLWDSAGQSTELYSGQYWTDRQGRLHGWKREQCVQDSAPYKPGGYWVQGRIAWGGDDDDLLYYYLQYCTSVIPGFGFGGPPCILYIRSAL